MPILPTSCSVAARLHQPHLGLRADPAWRRGAADRSPTRSVWRPVSSSRYSAAIARRLEHLDARFLELQRPAMHGLEERAILFADVLIQEPRLQLVAHAQRQLRQIERLGEKVARAERQRRGDAPRRELSPVTTSTGRCSFVDPWLQHLQQLEAIAPRHVQVEDDQIGRRASAAAARAPVASASVAMDV